ncbi:MAG: AI-2E family transporter [Bacteroides sp.]|nr:AI-2E family transporter [Bacteroides sp.]
MPKQLYWNRDRIMNLIIGLAVAAALICLLRYLRDVLLPFFVACFLAYLLQPIVEFNRRWTHERGRAISSVLTLVQILILVGLVVYLFLPTVVKDLQLLGDILKSVSSGEKQMPDYYVAAIQFIRRYFDPDNVSSMLNVDHIETILSKGSSILQESIDVIIHTIAWLLTLVYLLFIMIDYPEISRGFKLIIPDKYRPSAMMVVNDVQTNMNSYFRGQSVVALFAMVFYCVGFSIVRMPLAIPMGILVGILYMIPYFQYVTLIPVAAICFIYSLGGDVSFLPQLGKCGLVYVASQSICDYIVTPHVMGKEMGLNPAVILLSLSVWGSLLGIIGMIIALPVTALLMSYYERYISHSRHTHSPDSETEGDTTAPQGD